MTDKTHRAEPSNHEMASYDSPGFSQSALGRHLENDNTHDALIIVADGMVVFHNTKAEEITGHNSRELCEKPFLQHIHEDDRKSLSQAMAQLGECLLTFRFLNKNGDELKCLTGMVSIPWEAKTGVLLSLRDLSPRKEFEGQLQQTQKMEALGTLVAGVAHEINNPVNLIMYNMPIIKNIWNDFMPVLEQYSQSNPGIKFGGLKSSYLKENLHQLLSDVDMAANRIAKIVEDLKNFSKQSDISKKEPMRINSAVEGALRLAASTLKKSRISVEMHLSSHLPEIEANRHSIEQVILNIIINAAQAIDHDHGVIKIYTNYEIKSGQLLITIEDNGPGIDPAMGNRIFDPFVTSKQAHGGTGLGLSVSYNLVKAHNGEISFRNLDDKGTLFLIHLPVKTKGKTYRVLVADDDELIREIIVRMLKREEIFLVEEAFNGIEACIKLGTYKPDLLILDIMMPEMDGLEVCRSITRTDEFLGLKVLITTGHPEHAKVSELRALGFTNIMGKPFNLKNFSSEVHKILTS
ncbi:MAG: response regulator [Proteobacteria bacterium]|nr:response regulator [Pseudomonadota bacterium]MBU4471466.1 response regulator [Pseudomonadota bacterium]MCG2752472.1 ATP-binding protein [Desulfobacteraceae bacterium]